MSTITQDKSADQEKQLFNQKDKQLSSSADKISNNTRKLFLFFLGFIVFAVVIAVIVVAYFLQPVDSSDQTLIRFVIPKGRSTLDIAQQLKDKGLIKNPIAFMVYYRLNQDQEIQAGSFELSRSMSVGDIFQRLSQGTDDVWITLIEGLRREEIAQSLDQYNLTAYDKQDFLSQTVGSEGQLFPDTYLISKETSTQKIISLLQNTFEKKIEQLQPAINQSPWTLSELLIMASLLEREAQGKEQMQIVSGVLWKRLEMGMPLQVDASLQYAKGFNEEIQSWWTVPKTEDKKINSKFNTYQNPGLPPHPICNPGLDAIEASINPTSSDYLYYLHDPQGQIHFAETLDEHNQNINRYLR